MDYYSDQFKGNRSRELDTISPNVWGGIVAILNKLISTGAFGMHFPAICPDGAGTFSTDEHTFRLALNAEIPDIEYPFITEKPIDDSWNPKMAPFAPDYLTILDTIQFCYEHVAKPINDSYHSFFQHYHLDFDEEAGKEEFRSKVNRIFSRNGISYELQNNGNIIRLAPEILAEALYSSRFQTQDSTLNQMLEDARIKFLNPDEKIRRESLERLWDAWERIKTLLDPSNKKKSIGLLLDNCADEPKFRELIENEAKELTNIGNNFQIRHSEIGQVKIERSSQVDYIFHRLFSLILLALRSIKK